MLNKDGKYDFMVRLEIKDSSHNKSIVLDKTNGTLKMYNFIYFYIKLYYI